MVGLGHRDGGSFRDLPVHKEGGTSPLKIKFGGFPPKKGLTKINKYKLYLFFNIQTFMRVNLINILDIILKKKSILSYIIPHFTG